VGHQLKMAEEAPVTEPPTEGGEGSPLPLPPPPAAKPLSLMEQLEAMSMGAKTSVEASTAASADLTKKATRQRRKSRDLEQTVFGMHLTDQAELKKKFDAIDVDGNGTLEKHELKAALQATGRTVTDKKLTEIFNKYDNDKNGTFDFKEFCTMIKDWNDNGDI